MSHTFAIVLTSNYVVTENHSYVHTTYLHVNELCTFAGNYDNNVFLNLMKLLQFYELKPFVGIFGENIFRGIFQKVAQVFERE